MTHETADSAVDSAPFAMLLAEVRAFWKPLADKPEETAEGLLAALWRTACGAPVSVDRALAGRLPPLDAAARARLARLIARRRAGEPLAHLTRRQCFLGLELLASPEALIPRKETEILARAALAKLHALDPAEDAIVVLDACTGSANLALAFAHYEPRASVFAADLCPRALRVARLNRERLGLDARVELRQGDLLEPFEDLAGGCDLLSCNPPYVSTGKVKRMHPEIARFEPEAAFNGGTYGLSILAKLLREAPRFLRPSGWLAVEVGVGQGEWLVRQLRRSGRFADIEPRTDDAGEVRAVLARRSA